MKRIGASVIALAAIAALYFLVFDSPAGRNAGTGDGGDAGQEGTDLIAGQDDAATKSGAETPASYAVLFSSGKKRFGPGALRGQLKWFDSGEAAPNLRVKIAGRGRKGEAIDYTLTTDAAGAFSITDVPASDALMALAAAGTEHERAVQSVVVEPGGVSDLGVVWLGQRGLLEGRVTDNDGEPLAGADVSVHEGFGSVLDAMSRMQDLIKKLDQPPESDHKAKTKADGTFAIADVAPGAIVVLARAAGYEPAVEEMFKTAKAEADRVDFKLVLGVPIRGVVVNPDGKGVGNARVVMIQQRGMVAGFLARTFATTDAQGRFELVGPPGGADNVGVMVAAKHYPSSLFEIKSAGRPQRFELVGGAELSLRVIETTSGKPLENADLMAFLGDGEQMTGQPKTLITAVTDEKGQATFYARPGAIQMLWIKHPRVGNQIYAKQMGLAGVVEIDDVTLKPGMNRRTVKVKAGVRVHGIVKADSGEPIAGARIRAMGGMGMGVDTLSDAEGRYECLINPMMMMGMIATAPGWIQDRGKPEATAPPAQPGEEVERDIVMKRAVSVTGRVVGPDGEPLSGARVRLTGDGGGGFFSMQLLSPNAEAVTTAGGRFLLDGVAPGTTGAHIVARAKGFIDSKSEAFDVAASGTTTAPQVTLAAGVSVSVEVTDRRGDAVGRAELNLEKRPTDSVNFDPMEGMMGSDRRMADAAGKAVLTAIPPGGLTVIARARGYAATRGKLQLVADAKDPYTLEITLRDAVPVKGRVTDQGGRPIVGADVDSVERIDGADETTWVPRVRAVSGSDGTFILDGLPNITLTLEISAKGFPDRRVEVIGANRETVEARLQKRQAGVQREIEAVEAELQEIYGKFGSAKGDDQKKLLAEMQRLQQKLMRLKGEGGPASAEPVEDGPPVIDEAEADG